MRTLGLILSIWMLFGNGYSQHWIPARNPVHPQKPFDWIYYTTSHFDLHYYGRSRTFGDKIARLCEQAYYELSTRLDFLPENRMRVFLFNTTLDYFQGTSAALLDPPKYNGVTLPPQSTAFVCFNDQQNQLYANLKTQIIRVYIKQLMSGGLVQNILHNDLTFYLPDWYLEGLSAYLGAGWTSTDEMIIRGINVENATRICFQKPNAPAAETVRKSLWRYIEKQYGVSKTPDIIYMTMVARSVEAGIMTVLGLNMAEFTQRWETYLTHEYSQNNTEQPVLQQFKPTNTLPKNSRLIVSNLSPDGNTIAALLESKGRIRLWTTSREDDKWNPTAITTFNPVTKIIQDKVSFPLTWSPDGKTIIGTLPTRNSWEVFYYQPSTHEIYRSFLKKQLDWINHIAVSPDKSSLVITASIDGQVDLFRLNWQSETVVPLTKDLFWESNPVFSQDGKSVFFASNRGSLDTFSLKQIRADADIFKLSFKNNNEVQIDCIVAAALSNEYPVAMLSATDLLIRSDASGLYQLIRYNLNDKTWNFITNIREGLFGASYSATTNRIAITNFTDGKWSVFQKDSFSTKGVQMIQPTKFALQRMSEADALVLKQREDSLETVRDSMIAAQPSPEIQDTVRKINTRYYVFDEEDNDTTRKDRRTYTINKKKKRNQPQGPKVKSLFDPNFVQIASPKRYQAYPSKFIVGTTFEMDPFFKFRSPNFVEIRDPLLRYEVKGSFTPYIDFRSSDMAVSGSWFSSLWAWQLGADKMSRFFKNPAPLRYNAIRGWAGLNRILGPYESVGLSLETTFFNRLDLRLKDSRQLDGKATLYGARLKFQHDNTVRNKQFQLSGTQANVEAVTQFNTSYKSIYFTTLTGDIRHYRPLLRVFTLALRMSAGVSMGMKPQRYFIGGWDNWINREFQNEGNIPIDQDVPEFYYSQAITPIRGLPFNARNGKQYLLANVELRLPLIGNSLHRLPHKFPYNLQWITFYDVGTAWKTGNPFSQRNPIDVEYVVRPPLTVSVQSLKSPFLQSFGTGLRALILGYSFRADVAWGIEDNTLLSPRVGLTIGYDF
ncbi:MAG: hypothetical protein LC115_12710 [Bacteroidia bacterium]|nr:hypothetical protein [Bacteroidia bacterium]